MTDLIILIATISAVSIISLLLFKLVEARSDNDHLRSRINAMNSVIAMLQRDLSEARNEIRCEPDEREAV